MQLLHEAGCGLLHRIVGIIGKTRQVHCLPATGFFVHKRRAAFGNGLPLFIERRDINPSPVTVNLQVVYFEDHFLLTSPAVRDRLTLSAARRDRSASWPWVSPDSKWVACEYSPSAGKEQLAVIPIEGGAPAKLFDIPPQANFRYGIRWTGDGKAITYRDWGSGLWRQPVEGGPPQRIQGLPAEKIYSYNWSRDGKTFAFTRGNEIRDIVVISNSR